MKKGKIQQNLDYMEIIRQSGREYCFKSELPFPESANRCKNESPVLAIEKGKIYLKTLEE